MQPTKLVGASPAILALHEEIHYAAKCDAKVLITGESGAGKEIVARLIHSSSARSRSTLVTVNCAALSETLLETELFGHVRGSFTGAYRDRLGAFEQANRGTVFMDEIGETSPRMQGLLLRFLETGEIQRVGSDQVQNRVDVRVIAATNRVLVESVANKTFREDLYYRLNVIHLRVPALRERLEDIPVLLDFFLDQFARQYQVDRPTLSAESLQTLTEHTWPGNVRELKNVVERLVIRARSGEIRRDDLPLEVLRAAARHLRCLSARRPGLLPTSSSSVWSTAASRSGRVFTHRSCRATSRATTSAPSSAKASSARRATTRSWSNCSTCPATTTNAFSAS